MSVDRRISPWFSRILWMGLAMSPAALLVLEGVLQKLTHSELTPLAWIALIGGPLLLFACSRTFLLARGERFLIVKATVLAALLCCVNLGIGVAGCAFISPPRW